VGCPSGCHTRALHGRRRASHARMPRRGQRCASVSGGQEEESVLQIGFAPSPVSDGSRLSRRGRVARRKVQGRGWLWFRREADVEGIVRKGQWTALSRNTIRTNRRRPCLRRCCGRRRSSLQHVSKLIEPRSLIPNAPDRVLWLQCSTPVWAIVSNAHRSDRIKLRGSGLYRLNLG